MIFIRIVCPALSRLVTVVTADINVALISAKGRYARTLFPAWPETPHAELFFSQREVTEIAEELAWQFLIKFFPDEGRFSLAPIEEQNRIGFRTDPSGSSIGDLLKEAGLQRFIDLDWAIDTLSKEPEVVDVLSFYVDALSDNPRMLEQGYDVLLRATEAIRGKQEQARTLALSEARRAILIGLGRLFLAPLASEILRLYGQPLRVASTVGTRISVSFLPSVGITVRPMRVLRASSWRQSDTAKPDTDWKLFAVHELRLLVRDQRVEPGHSETASWLPRPLAAGFFFLKELQRPEFALLAADSYVPETSLGRIGPIECRQPWHGWAGRSDFDQVLAFDTLYPLGVIQSDTLLGLPMPGWQWPIQWSIFSRYWDRVAVLDAGLSERKQKEYVFFHSVEAAIKISRMNPLEQEPAPAGQLHTDVKVPSSFDMILQHLRKPYELDVINGDGVLAEWVEQGFFKFLKTIEAQGIQTFATSGLTAEKVKRLVLEVTVEALLTSQPVLRQDLRVIVEEIDQQALASYRGSRLLKAFREGIALTGAPDAVAGDLQTIEVPSIPESSGL